MADGEQKTLFKLKEMALTDLDVQNMAMEDEQDLINMFKENCERKKWNAWPNNVSAACDTIATMDHVTDEVGHVGCMIYLQT